MPLQQQLQQQLIFLLRPQQHAQWPLCHHLRPITAAWVTQAQHQQHGVLPPLPLQQQRVAGYAAAAPAASDERDDTPQQQQQQPYPSKHERRVAHLKFCQERAAWRRQVKALRVQWLAEHRARVAAQRAATKDVQRQIAALQQMRDASRQQDRRLHQLEQQIRLAQLAVDAANRRAASAYREELRQKTLQQHRAKWRSELEEASRTWIPREQLDARIAAALDAPASL